MIQSKGHSDFNLLIANLSLAWHRSTLRYFLYVIADNPSESVDSLNQDLKRIKDWADEWLVKFSPPKTKSLTISRERLPKAQPLTFDDTDIEEVTSHKHLGLTISEDLSGHLWFFHFIFLLFS